MSELKAYNVVATADVNPDVVGNLGCTEWPAYDKEEADKVIAAKDAEIAQLQAMLEERNRQIGELKEEKANKAEWKPFDARPELDCPFRIKYGANAAPGPSVLRMHREPRELVHLQCQDGSEWKDVDLMNSGWIVRNCEWQYIEEPVKEQT